CSLGNLPGRRGAAIAAKVSSMALLQDGSGPLRRSNRNREGTEALKLLPHTRAVLQPLKIRRGRRGEPAARPALHRRSDGVADHPVMRLGMAVGEGEIHAAIVIGTGEVAPLVIVEAIDEETVVDGVRM